MRISKTLIIALLAGSACADPGPTKNAFGRAQFFNGPTTGTTSAPSLVATGVPPANGIWAVSPDMVVLHAQRLILAGTAGTKTIDLGCAVPFQKTNATLKKITDCTFVTDTGTYSRMTLVFSDQEDLLIDDPANGFYTTPTGVTLTPPAGGAKVFTFTVPQAVNGEWSATFDLTQPLQLVQTAPLVLSVVVNGLHFLWVQVNNGQASLTGTTSPQRPGLVASINTIAGVEYYVHQQIGTAGAYCTSLCSTPIPVGIKSFALYYASPVSPTMAGLDYNGFAANCTNLGPSFIGNTGKSYIGLDAAGNVSWAMPSSQDYTSYVAERRVQRLTTVGQTTTLYCRNRTTDPAPSGGSYTSGAPAINSPANSLGTFVLIAK